MLKWKEDALLKAFRKLGQEQQDYYFDAIYDAAIERDKSKPRLRLVSSRSAVSEGASLSCLVERS